jgi:hypothetical protein
MSMRRFQDPTVLSRWATAALCAYIAARALLALRLLVVNPGAQPVHLFNFLYWVSLILCPLLILPWIYRTNANGHRFSREISISPGWAVGWFFIPVANLVMPFRGVNETWKASQRAAGRPEAARSAPVRWWWGLWLAGNVATNVAVVTGADTSYAGPFAHFFNLVAAALGIAGSLVLIQLMSRLNRAQLIAARGSIFA